MNFEFSNDQKSLQDQVNRHLGKACPIGRVQGIMDGDIDDRARLWAELAQLGYLGTALPEEYGGVGFGYLELCLIAQEFGRFALPVPFASSVCMASEAILLFGNDRQKAEWLPKLAVGDATATFAWSETNSSRGIFAPQSACTNDKLSGQKIPVPDADMADIAVVLAQDDDGRPGYFIANLDQAGVEIRPVDMVDGSWPHSTVSFQNAACEPLSSGSVPIERVFERAAILMAFEQIGGAQACLDMAREYAQERHAFGRQIGSFQALKHKMADMFVKNELALSHAYYAAWALASNTPEIGLAASGARLAATRAYEFAAAENIEIHGGVGFTWEFPCHIYYKRSRMMALALGSQRNWKNMLVEHLKARRAA